MARDIKKQSDNNVSRVQYMDVFKYAVGMYKPLFGRFFN